MLLLSGGRHHTRNHTSTPTSTSTSTRTRMHTRSGPSKSDVSLWVSADGSGISWREYSLSYHHNLGVEQQLRRRDRPLLRARAGPDARRSPRRLPP